MASLMAGIQTALQALLSHQQAIQVIDHNVANANTPGYHRQEAVLSAGVPTIFNNMEGFYTGELGTGVTVERIKRYNLDFFDNRFRTQVGEASRWQLESGVLKQVEVSLGETGPDNLVSKLDSFWSGWQSLSTDPSDMILKADVLEKANSLAKAIQSRNATLLQIRADQNVDLMARAEEINAIGEQVALLNAEISRITGAKQQPNDQMDKRDLLLDRLAELTGSRTDIQPDGTANVSINGHTLVQGPLANKLTVVRSPLDASIAWEDGSAFTPTSGELAGLIDLRDKVIPDYQDKLNQLAYNLTIQVNALHNPAAAPVPPDVAGKDFFVSLATQKNAAALISVNPEMNDLTNILGSTAASPGDGRIAKAIAGLKQTAVAGLGNATFNEFYTQKASELGLFTNKAIGYAKDRALTMEALSNQRESLEGVSLDEEAANLIKAQKAFQAATRMVNVMDEMMDRIINNMGLVGR